MLPDPEGVEREYDCCGMFDPSGVVDLNAAAYRGFGTPGYSRSSPSGMPSAGIDLMFIPPKTAKNQVT